MAPDKKNAAVNFDNEQKIREIRAILKMNTEMLDRCKKFMTCPKSAHRIHLPPFHGSALQKSKCER